jgi:MYXO-CTERM domain-containing protein
MDSYLDAGETGRIRIRFENTGEAVLTGTEVTVSASNPNVTFLSGSSFTVGSTPQFGVSEVSFEIAVTEALTSIEALGLTIAVSNADACETLVEHTTTRAVNFDFGPSDIDTVENPTPAWRSVGLYADVWSRTESPLDNHLWHGVDSGFITDTVLESPNLQVSATEELIISFDHLYTFEADTVFWDGGVIEISNNGGVTWADISTLVDPGYTGAIVNTAGNPLSDRLAYSGVSELFPSFTTKTLNLGTALAGQNVRIRFRIGTDAAVGAYGWDIDNISVQGITNLPFSTIVDDVGECSGVPLADAGSDRMVVGGTNVVIDASGSSDPDGDSLTYSWEQVAGPQVVLLDGTAVQAKFTAPVFGDSTVLRFEVTVSDGKGAARDAVEITVLPDAGGEPDAGPTEPDAGSEPDAAPQPDAGEQPDSGVVPPGDGGGCCQASNNSPAGSAGLMFLVMLAVLRLTRRRRA